MENKLYKSLLFSCLQPNHKQLLRLLKERNLTYKFLSEAKRQHPNISDMFYYFNCYMQKENIYSTLNYTKTSIKFDAILDNTFRNKMHNLLLDCEDYLQKCGIKY